MIGRKDIKDLRLHKRDTGSADVQIVLLTHRIKLLQSKYLLSNKKESSYRREMLVLLNKRQGLIDYLKLTDTQRYQKIIEVLEINWL